MSIVVEFFGIPRSRTGVSQVRICEGLPQVSLGQVIEVLAHQFPEFANTCTVDGKSLRHGYIANIDGQRFVAGNDQQLIADGQTVLILSSDAGG